MMSMGSWISETKGSLGFIQRGTVRQTHGNTAGCNNSRKTNEPRYNQLYYFIIRQKRRATDVRSVTIDIHAGE